VNLPNTGAYRYYYIIDLIHLKREKGREKEGVRERGRERKREREKGRERKEERDKGRERESIEM